MSTDTTAAVTSLDSDATERLLVARRGAIAESGWDRGFRFVQPRNLAFWVYVILVGYGIVTLFKFFAPAAPVVGQAIVAATILFALYGALFWWFTMRIDRYAHQSRKLIVVAFVWGAFAASVGMAAHANTPILSLYGKAFGQAWASDWGAGLTAPFTEELAKGSGLLLLIALAPRLVSTAFDGFILGAFIGLGFQVVEDVQYALGSALNQFGANPLQNAATTIVLRFVAGIASHVLFSAVFCAGLVYFLGRPGEPRRRGRGLALMLTAMLLHGLWDDTGGILGSHTNLFVPTSLLLIVLALIVVTRVFAMTVPRERAYMRAVMAPEAANEVITTEELGTLSGDRKARRAYRKAGHGVSEKRRRRHLLEAAHDLAEELAGSGGRDTARVQYARTEISRLRG